MFWFGQLVAQNEQFEDAPFELWLKETCCPNDETLNKYLDYFF